jgi:hypothetical protein
MIGGLVDWWIDGPYRMIREYPGKWMNQLVDQPINCQQNPGMDMSMTIQQSTNPFHPLIQ